MKKTFDPFKGLVLDSYEQEIEDYINSHDIPLTPLAEQELEKLGLMAENTLDSLKKDKKMNIRVTTKTIIKLKKKAAKLGLPYQTLAGSILHQYANS